MGCKAFDSSQKMGLSRFTLCIPDAMFLIFLCALCVLCGEILKDT